jgi:hypothetical protein
LHLRAMSLPRDQISGASEQGSSPAAEAGSDTVFPVHLQKLFPAKEKLTLDPAEKVKVVRREAVAMLQHSTDCGPDGTYWADVLGLHDGNGQDVALMLVIFCILFCFLILSQLDAQWVLSSRQMEADCADLVMNALDSFARNSDILRLVLFVWGTLEFSSLTTAFFATLWDDYKLTDIDIESIQFYNKCYLDILGRAVVASSAIILTFAPLLSGSLLCGVLLGTAGGLCCLSIWTPRHLLRWVVFVLFPVSATCVKLLKDYTSAGRVETHGWQEPSLQG